MEKTTPRTYSARSWMLIALLCAVALITAAVLMRNQKPSPEPPSPLSPEPPASRTDTPPADAAKVRLELSGPSQMRVGETAVVEIKLVTSAAISVEGADIVITYDPALLAYEDRSLKAEGKLAQLVASSVQARGTLRFSQLPSSSDTKISFDEGSETIARLSFRALSAGAATLSFAYAPGGTADTNIAFEGNDILTGVVSHTVTISE